MTNPPNPEFRATIPARDVVPWTDREFASDIAAFRMVFAGGGAGVEIVTWRTPAVRGAGHAYSWRARRVIPGPGGTWRAANARGDGWTRAREYTAAADRDADVTAYVDGARIAAGFGSGGVDPR